MEHGKEYVDQWIYVIKKGNLFSAKVETEISTEA
jgi:hypothetical protein